MVGGLGMMFGNLIHAFFRGKKAEANPWGGATLEWTLPSPPAFENWEHNPPTITHGPYVFNGQGHHAEEKSPAAGEPLGPQKKGH